MPTNNFTYRKATISDLERLKELEQRVIEAERPFNSFIRASKTSYYDLNDLLSSENSCVMVAECEGKIVACGYVKIQSSKPAMTHDIHGYLGFMCVTPKFRGQSLIQEIIQRLIKSAKAKGVSVFYLDVYTQNSGAIKAYEKAGFTSSMIEMKLDVSQYAD